jgi:hypothetical protein
MSDVDKKLAEIRERHELGDRWRYGPSMMCPQSHEDRAFLLVEIARYRAGLQKIVDADGFWDAPSLARDLLAGKDVT